MDRRVVRTVRRIKDSFIELLKKEDFSKITVKMICDSADIERKTFYLHFKDKYELLDVIVKDHLDAFREKVRSMPEKKPTYFYIEALKFCDRHHDLFERFYNGRGSVPIRKKIQQYILERFEERYGQDNDPAVSHFISAGIGGVFEAYVNGKIKENKEKIANDVVDLVDQAIALYEENIKK